MHRLIAVAVLILLLTGCDTRDEQAAHGDPPATEATPTSEPTEMPEATTTDAPAAEPLSWDMIEAARGLNATTYENTAAAYEALHVAAQRDCYPMLDASGNLKYSADLEAQYAEEMAELSRSTGPVSAKDKLELFYATSVAAMCVPALPPL